MRPTTDNSGDPNLKSDNEPHDMRLDTFQSHVVRGRMNHGVGRLRGQPGCPRGLLCAVLLDRESLRLSNLPFLYVPRRAFWVGHLKADAAIFAAIDVDVRLLSLYSKRET